MMNQDIKDKWIAALRSGKYQQGKYNLRKESSFCCLGVLCDISGKMEWKTDTTGSTIFSYDKQKASLPESILGWADLRSYQQEPLVDRNDGGKSFSEIADYIEENL